MPLALLAGLLACAGGAASAQALNTNRHILVLPAVQWNDKGTAWRFATQQTASDLARVMGGLKFGLIPEEVSQHMPTSGGDLHWSDLPAAKEFSEDVRYVWLPMQGAGALRAPITSCFGEASYVVLLFLNNALFRVSWRFLPGQGCPSPRDAAEELYGAYVPLAATVAISMHYHTGYADVVDVTDPGAGPLLLQRWQMNGQ